MAKYFSGRHAINAKSSGGLLSVLLFISFIGLLAAIAIPAYQDYTMRVHVVEILKSLDPLKSSIYIHYKNNNNSFPIRFEEISESTKIEKKIIQTKYVTAVNYSYPGIIELILTATVGDKITLTAVKKNGQLKWVCKADGVRKSILPVDCR